MTTDQLEGVIKIIKGNGLVILPTDTVYGFFTRAFNDTAFKCLESIKRSRHTPYSITFNNTASMLDWYGKVDLVRMQIIGELTPGPVTMVLPYNDAVPDNYRYPSQGAGLRVSSNKVLNQVMDNLDFPLWSTSANRAGGRAPVRYDEIDPSILKEVDAVIDDGETDYLRSSDVIDLRSRPFTSIREGPWHDKIQQILSKSEDTFYIVVVCTGNLCRSPLAEALIRKNIDAIPNANVNVQSAGVYAVGGSPATDEMIVQGSRLSVDLSAHAARAVTNDLIARAGLILTVSSRHTDMIISSNPQASQKTRLLGEFLGLDEIPDPYQLGDAAYRQAADLIAQVVDSWSGEFRDAFSEADSA